MTLSKEALLLGEYLSQAQGQVQVHQLHQLHQLHQYLSYLEGHLPLWVSHQGAHHYRQHLQEALHLAEAD